MKLSISEAKEIANKIKNEGEQYIKKYITNNKENLTLVLKTHLIMEKIIDEILSAALVDAKEIKEDMTFRKKISVIQALGIGRLNIIDKLKSYNALRNKFAHNLDYAVKMEDISLFLTDSRLIKNGNVHDLLIQVSAYIIYFLMGVREYHQKFPFYISCFDNQLRFKRDKGFSIKNIQDKYDFMGMEEYLSMLRLK